MRLFALGGLLLAPQRPLYARKQPVARLYTQWLEMTQNGSQRSDAENPIPMKAKPFRRKPFRLIFAAIAVVLLIAYVLRLGEEYPVESLDTDTARHGTIVIFGATGTAGDGVLKAAMSDSDVEKIHVVTRRTSPRIDAGVATGLVQMTTHMDYLDYAPLQELLSEVDTVY
jgi:hypothetical protein